MRTRGTFGYNLPPRASTVITPANFAIYGIIGRFARGLVDVVDLNNVSDLAIKCGGYKAGYYGRYVMDRLFTNLRGSSAKGYVRMYVASDAVQASATLNDNAGSPAPTLKIAAAYQTIIDKSADGNDTGYTLTRGARANTTITANASSGATTLTLASVAQVRVGDILQIVSTGPVTHYCKVSAINENLKTVTVSATTNAVVAADTVALFGFQIVTYRRTSTGAAAKVDLPENKIWLSLESENTEFYVGNAFANHPYLQLTDLASVASPLPLRYPSNVTSVTFLTSGSSGTAPSSTSDWDLYSQFDNKPVRFLFNSDTTISGVNLAGEAYCSSRTDTPVWIYNIAALQTKSQLLTTGGLYQRSNQVQGIIPASWRNVSDPIGQGQNPVIRIPVNGAIVGAWIYTALTFLGIHQAPAGDDVALLGFVDTPDSTEDRFTEDERTEILSAGINLVQFITGVGLSLRSFRTPSTNGSFLWGTWLFMQNFVKVSAVESLHSSESRPNRLQSLQEKGRAISDFGRKLYQGSFPYGIDPAGAFGTFTRSDGKPSQFEDVFTVQVDQFNNPQSSINAGEGNVAVYMFPPPLLESLGVGVGFTIPL